MKSLFRPAGDKRASQTLQKWQFELMSACVCDVTHLSVFTLSHVLERHVESNGKLVTALEPVCVHSWSVWQSLAKFCLTSKTVHIQTRSGSM